MTVLRERLTAELVEHDHYLGYPTWWWRGSKRRGESTVTDARKELKKMEGEGLVVRARSRGNQIQWRLVGASNAD